VLFVGEAPGKDEDREGLPFVGRAGRALDRAISTVGLDPGSIGIVNLIKCRPPENRFDGQAAETCRPYLDRQLDLLRPERIVTLGRHALQALVPSAPPITEAAGFVQRGPRGSVFPLLHPAAPMHAPKYAARWEHDLTELRMWLALPLTQTS
jgi:uracil-DNA glycosylase